MARQQVYRRTKVARGVLLALQLVVLLFAVIFFALVIEYTETSVRIVPLRAVQLAGACVLAWLIGRMRRWLSTAYAYEFSAERFMVEDVRRPKQPQPLWSTSPDSVLRWGSVGTPGFAQLLERHDLPRHNLFVHRTAPLTYIHYWSHAGEGLAVIEADVQIIACLERYCAAAKEVESRKEATIV